MLVRFGVYVIAVTLFLAPTMIDVLAQDSTEVIDLGNGTRILIVHENASSILSWDNFWFIVVTIGAAIATAFLTPLLRERYKIREQYLVPYRQWCITFSGMLHEFDELCCVVRRSNYISDTDLIIHVWAMHQEVEKGFRWLHVVKQDNKNVGEKLDGLMDGVDVLWHELQELDNVLKAKQATTDDFYLILKDLSLFNPAITARIVDKIEKTIREVGKSKEDKVFDQRSFDMISTMLVGKIPSKYQGLQNLFTLKQAKQIITDCYP